jgi:amphi-Trp domain-containing protein
MSNVEVKREELLTRAEAAHRLAALADALAEGEKAEVALGASTLKVHVPDQVRCEIEIEIDGDEVELELELKWSMAKPAASTRTNAKPATGTTKTAAARRVSTPAGRRSRGTRR